MNSPNKRHHPFVLSTIFSAYKIPILLSKRDARSLMEWQFTNLQSCQHSFLL